MSQTLKSCLCFKWLFQNFSEMENLRCVAEKGKTFIWLNPTCSVFIFSAFWAWTVFMLYSQLVYISLFCFNCFFFVCLFSFYDIQTLKLLQPAFCLQCSGMEHVRGIKVYNLISLTQPRLRTHREIFIHVPWNRDRGWHKFRL